jgi:hypothetical protein
LTLFVISAFLALAMASKAAQRLGFTTSAIRRRYKLPKIKPTQSTAANKLDIAIKSESADGGFNGLRRARFVRELLLALPSDCYDRS